MRSEANKNKVQEFLVALGSHVRSSGKIYLTGGATALLQGWRDMTVDIDIKPDPEPVGLFEAIAELKEKLDINLELASPDQFIPELPGWRERSQFIGRFGKLDFFHYDFYAQALSKLDRGHSRDLFDVVAMLDRGLIVKKRLWELFQEILPQLIRYPSIDEPSFIAAVEEFCRDD